MQVPFIEEDVGNAIYDILVEHAGANEYYRDMFVWTHATDPPGEWRFQGKLGFGGKFWHTGRAPWRVSFYPEDETPEVKAITEKVNSLLAELQARQS